MRLLIVSDTFLYKTSLDELEVFEPTLREIESVSGLFTEILWLGYLQQHANPGHARAPIIPSIRLKSLPVVQGGKTLSSKWRILPQLPRLVWIIAKHIRNYDVIHSRGPSVPAFVCVVLSCLLRKKIYWHKYAGNWMEPVPPFMFGVQKKLLTRAVHTKVTINGKWPGQPAHIVSLENPCFTEEERKISVGYAKSKPFNKPLVLCFTGLMAESKGVIELMKAFRLMDTLSDRVRKIIMAGDGPALNETKVLAAELNVPVEFTGYINRNQLNEVYKQSHVLLLPSRSEGFPKVVAEAASFGCIPVVTDVSSIGQYVVHAESGFLLKDNQASTIANMLEELFIHTDLKRVSEGAVSMSEKFTYERFRLQIANTVLKSS